MQQCSVACCGPRSLEILLSIQPKGVQVPKQKVSTPDHKGCFYKKGIGVLITRTTVLGIYIRHPIIWKLPYGCFCKNEAREGYCSNNGKGS